MIMINYTTLQMRYFGPKLWIVIVVILHVETLIDCYFFKLTNNYYLQVNTFFKNVPNFMKNFKPKYEDGNFFRCCDTW